MEKRKIKWLIVFVIAGLLITAGFYLINAYQLLVEKEEEARSHWSIIESQYQERVDILSELAELTTSRKEKDSRVEKVVIIWETARETDNVASMILTTPKIDQELEIKLAFVADDPTLKSAENVLVLQKRLQTTSSEILSEQEKYNDAVTEYNRRLKVYPARVFAGWFGLSSYSYYEGLDS